MSHTEKMVAMLQGAIKDAVKNANTKWSAFLEAMSGVDEYAHGLEVDLCRYCMCRVCHGPDCQCENDE